MTAAGLRTGLFVCSGMLPNSVASKRSTTECRSCLTKNNLDSDTLLMANPAYTLLPNLLAAILMMSVAAAYRSLLCFWGSSFWLHKLTGMSPL
ncbi:hypothetical protein EV127DRAFT_433857 [Xylaria flabelliformis]|nr:hypothetical protein EV127DRAFT_433857 [Xylaria flabelliformis]